MTEFQRYLAEEVAEDHADGLVSRREALRRLGLLGLSGAAAASLLAGAVARAGKGAGGCRSAPGRKPLGDGEKSRGRGTPDPGDHVRGPRDGG